MVSPRFAIETEMADPSTKSEGRNNPFMKLAGYIGVGSAPQNEGANKIAMTAPVTMKQSEEVGEAAIHVFVKLFFFKRHLS